MNDNLQIQLNEFFAGALVATRPLLVGMTGHRHILASCRAEIQEQAERFLADLVRIWRSFDDGANELPILIFDGMAEGADQMVAQAAFDLQKSDSAAAACLNLIAVLPMPLADYRQDFDTPDLLAAFESKLEQTNAIIELPLTDRNRRIRAANPAGRIHRMEQYALLGQFLTARSDLLLALWDGQGLNDSPPGSTASVVRAMQNRFAAAAASAVDVFQIPSPREKKG